MGFIKHPRITVWFVIRTVQYKQEIWNYPELYQSLSLMLTRLNMCTQSNGYKTMTTNSETCLCCCLEVQKEESRKRKIFFHKRKPFMFWNVWKNKDKLLWMMDPKYTRMWKNMESAHWYLLIWRLTGTVRCYRRQNWRHKEPRTSSNWRLLR